MGIQTVPCPDSTFPIDPPPIVVAASREQIRRYTYVDLVRGSHVLCGDDARFCNHSDHPNCHDFPDADGGTTVAARDIGEGEELTSDYSRFDGEHVPY